MIFLEAIRDELVNKGLGAEGVDLFIYEMPHEIKKGILLTERLRGATQDQYIPDWRETRFNLIVRDTEKLSAIKRNFEAVEAIKTQSERVLGGINFKQIYPLEDPIVFPVSEGHLIEAYTRLETQYVILDYTQ